MSGRDQPRDDYCYLTTIGRRTGRAHRIEIWYAADGDTLYLLAGGGRSSDWVRNLESDPIVSVDLDDDTVAGHARVLGPGAEEERARRIVYDKYAPRQAGDLTSWRESALAVAIDLEPSDRSRKERR